MEIKAASRRGFACRFLHSRSGQGMAEYLLMMAIVAAFLLASFPLFYKNILGAFFMVGGRVLGG